MLKDLHFVFLNASQILHLVFHQSAGDLFQCWGRNACTKWADEPQGLQGRSDTVLYLWGTLGIFKSNRPLHYFHGPR